MAQIDPQLEGSWKTLLNEERNKDYYQSLLVFLKEERSKYQVFPPAHLIFSALDHTPFDQVKVVLLGQDPYHGTGQAHGLSFSVPAGVKTPPSLRNIFKEMKADLGGLPATNDLTSWASQGVLLLNATLSVRSSSPGSHQNRGWEQFTDKIIQLLSDRRDHVVFILWGSYAQAKGRIIDRSKHCVIESPHPSPFSAHRGFFGSKPFSKANNYLLKHGKSEIVWI